MKMFLFFLFSATVLAQTGSKELDPKDFDTSEKYIEAVLAKDPNGLNGAVIKWNAAHSNQNDEGKTVSCTALGDGTIEFNGDIYEKKRSINGSSLLKSMKSSSKPQKKSPPSVQEQ